MKYYFLSILIFGFVFVFLGCSKEVELVDQDWSYANGICKVNFTLKNMLPFETEQKVKIVAHKQRQIGKGAIVNDIIGEKEVLVFLRSEETIKKTELLDLFPNTRPSMVVVKKIEVNQCRGSHNKVTSPIAPC